MVNGFDLDGISWGSAAVAFLLFPLLVILHELIHGITWAFFARNYFHSIDFGFIWSTFSPHCTCSEPLGKWQYLLGAAMPTLVLGGAVAVIGVLTNQFSITFLGRNYDFLRWRRFSNHTKNLVIPHWQERNFVLWSSLWMWLCCFWKVGTNIAVHNDRNWHIIAKKPYTYGGYSDEKLFRPDKRTNVLQWNKNRSILDKILLCFFHCANSVFIQWKFEYFVWCFFQIIWISKRYMR